MTDSNEVKFEALLGIITSSAREALAEYKKTGHGIPGADSPNFHPLDLATDTVALKKAIRLLEGAYHQLSAMLAPPQHTAYNFIHNFNWACADVAVRAGIADVLDKHPGGLSVDKLADAVNLDESNTARILRALALMGCFKEVEQDVFANTRVSLTLKSRSNFGCMAQIAHDFSKYATVLYETMTDPEFASSREVDKAPRGFALRKDGRTDSYWEAIKNDAEWRDVFHKGMFGLQEIFGAPAVLHQYPWHNVSSVVDIGCGVGAISMPLAKMFPHLSITNQDLPEIIREAQIRWEKNATEALLGGRVEFLAFNFLEEVPIAGKDVYYLRMIIHDWPDAEATTILRNIRKVMGPNSRVLIHESVLFHTVQEPGVQIDGLSIAPKPMLPNFGAGTHRAYHQDLGMWCLFNAKERTLDEFKTLGSTADLALTQVYDLVETMVMEFRIAHN
ncbi:S-adenosyl-L-methionine-dependent methyltransferase [Rhizopogon salebrosus TDB-379]|nr:S-adenosyl-L-methionine-dependent methyltransferase [Rhizopogon salebrosus TDB-379]